MTTYAVIYTFFNNRVLALSGMTAKYEKEKFTTKEDNKPAARDWSKGYLALAALNILTISISLFISQQFIQIYEASIGNHQSMSYLTGELFKLDFIASDLNEPGNRVFESNDIAAENQSTQHINHRHFRNLTFKPI